jgi:hypothetical protein
MPTFDEFRKTGRYHAAGYATKIAIVYHFFDSEGIGLTESEIFDHIKDDTSFIEFQKGFCYMTDRAELDRAFRKDGQTIKTVYKLDKSSRKTIKWYVNPKENGY